MSFEFLSQNLINTTTQYVVDSNTVLVEQLLIRDITKQYISTGFNDDLTTTTITINFDATTAVDRVALLEHNLKGYTAYYNGATANTFALTTTAATTASDFSSNSETSQYFRTTSVNCTSVTFDLKTTQTANAEKAIGYIYLGTLDLEWDRIPGAKDYKVKLAPKQVIHKLSDGGTRVQNIQDKWMVDIKFKNITKSFRDSLRTSYNSTDPMWFCPFGTTTSWDGVFFESVWEGPFDFYMYSDNAVSAGFSGSLRLRETAI